MASEISGLKSIEQLLGRLKKASPDAARRGLTRCGLIAKREAVANAPRSPTNKVHSKTLKRKRHTTRRRMPGGLEKSIEYEVSPAGDTCSVFVAANSYAGKYAARIHDEKGKTWRKRGPGTIAKGARADEKFIARAIKDNATAFLKIIQSELKKVLPK